MTICRSRINLENNLELTLEKIEVYRAAARRRLQARRQGLAHRHERAWSVARQAAEILREEFGAHRVMMFGSLVRRRGFHMGSDIDLAVWGLEERRYYRAVSRLLDLDPAIQVDLILGEEAALALLMVIKEEGVSV